MILQKKHTDFLAAYKSFKAKEVVWQNLLRIDHCLPEKKHRDIQKKISAAYIKKFNAEQKMTTALKKLSDADREEVSLIIQEGGYQHGQS